MPFGAVFDKFLLLSDFQESGVTPVDTNPYNMRGGYSLSRTAPSSCLPSSSF